MLAFRLLLSGILTISFALSPFRSAHAGLISAQGLGILSSEKLAAKGIQSLRTGKSESGELIYEFLGESGKVISTFVVGKSSPQVLKEFKPSLVRQYLHTLKSQAGPITIHKLKQFPLEAFAFFTAIGALTSSQLIFKFHENPVAMDQFLTSQKDPVGQLGFAAFMIANGLAAEPLMALIQSPKARVFIPYLGMSVGMMASNLVHEIGHFPHLKECSLELMGMGAANANGSACDKAYEEWTKLSLAEKGHEWAPGLFGMIASTALAGGLELGLKTGLSAAIAAGNQTGVSAARWATTRIVAVELAMTITPSGWGFRIGRFVYKVAQLAGFIYLDTLLRAPLTFTWKNAVQLGPELRDANRRLGILMANKRANGWGPEKAINQRGYPACQEKQTENCYKDLAEDLVEFQTLMAKWRSANMESVLTAHANWNEYLHSLSSQYMAARQFYFDFVSDVWKKKFQNPSGYVHLMDRTQPLFGVFPKGLQEDDLEKFLLQPNKILNMQIETLKDVQQAVTSQASEIEQAIQKLNLDEQKSARLIVEKISSQDLNLVAEALQEMRSRLGKDPSNMNIHSSRTFHLIFAPIFKALGNPFPMMKPGHAYLKLVEADPNQKVYQNVKFPKSFGTIQTPSATEYMASQMLFGPSPERGESSVAFNIWGFPSEFKPPKIRVQGRLQISQKTFSLNIPESISKSLFGFGANLTPHSGSSSQFESLFDVLRMGNLPPEILGDSSGHKIENWWSNHVEKDLVSAWLGFELKYENIIQDFHKRLFLESLESIESADSKNSVLSKVMSLNGALTNRGPISNGLLKGLEEERSIYLYILDSFIKAKQQQKYDVPVKDFEYSILQPARVLFSLQLGHPWTQNIANEWKKFSSLLSQIKSTPAKASTQAGEYLVSRVKNSDLENQIASIDQVMGSYPIDLNTLTPYQQNILKAAINGLKTTQQEILNYGLIINNASYVDRMVGDAESMNKPERRRCLNVPAAKGTQQWLAAQYQGCDR
jgi:hypothetical protein